MAGLSLILAAICVNGTCPTNNDTTENIYMSLDVGPSLQEENRTISFQRMQLNGQHLTVATLEDPPLSFTEIVNGTRVGRGVSFDLLDFLAEKLNFTYDVDVPKNNIIGADGDMEDSLIEMVNRTQADMAVAFIPLLGEPRKFVHYSSVTLDEGEWIMVMRRPAESANGSGLLAPFDYWVWILILISLLIVGPIIYVLIIIRNKITGDDAQKPYSLSHCAWFVYGALMKQGSTLSPIADSTRLLFATWWIFITILTSFYTANLTAFLTLSQFTLPFNTIDDILKKDKNFVALRGGGVEYAIINEGEPLEKLRVKRNLATFTSNTNDSETLIDYVERKDFVFIRDHPAIDHILYLDYQYRKNISQDNEKIHCPFAVAKIPVLKTKRAFIFPRNSTWRTAFDQELLNLVEAGIVKYLVNRNLPNAEICPQNLAGTERQLRNGDLMMTYYIMAAGFSTATVVFVTELIFRFLNEKNSKQSLSMHKRLPKKISSRSPFITNVTPPPPYGSIFNTSRDILVNVNNIKRAPDRSNGIKKFINGRDYMVFRGYNGESKLVPVRAPSATLFQYTYTE